MPRRERRRRSKRKLDDAHGSVSKEGSSSSIPPAMKSAAPPEMRCKREGCLKYRRKGGFCQVCFEEQSPMLCELNGCNLYKVSKNGNKKYCQIHRKLEHRLSSAPLPKINAQPSKPLFNQKSAVYAAWWSPEDDARDADPSWYAGIVSSYKVSNVPADEQYGYVRYYDVNFDDGDKLSRIPDHFVMSSEDYLLNLRKNNDGTKRTQWLGVKNVTDKSSKDLWAKYVGWYVTTIDGEEHVFSLLADALRAYDVAVVHREGAGTKRSDLNLPEEWECLFSAKRKMSQREPPIVKRQKGQARIASVASTIKMEQLTSTGKKKSSQDKVGKLCELNGCKISKVYGKRYCRTHKELEHQLSLAPLPRINCQQPSSAQKPLFNQKANVYAAWWSPEDKSRKADPSWYAGVVLSYKISKVPADDRYGHVRYYDIHFEDGDKLDRIPDHFVMSEEDYLLNQSSNNNGTKSQWLGVKNVTDKSSKDLWAKYVGWYIATIDGEEHVFPLLADALRACDAAVVQRKGTETKRSDLNLPEEWESLFSANESDGKPSKMQKCQAKKAAEASTNKMRQLTSKEMKQSSQPQDLRRGINIDKICELHGCRMYKVSTNGDNNRYCRIHKELGHHLSSDMLSRNCQSSSSALKPRFNQRTNVYAAWWSSEDKSRKSDPSWYAGTVSSYKISNVPADEQYGYVRYYDIHFEDGDKLDKIPDHLVMSAEDYLLHLRKNNGTKKARWLGVRNVTDKSSKDSWAKYVGWYTATIDGEEHAFSLLADALRAYDVAVVRRKGTGTMRSDLNLPEEWDCLFKSKARVVSKKQSRKRPHKESSAQAVAKRQKRPARNATVDSASKATQLTCKKKNQSLHPQDIRQAVNVDNIHEGQGGEINAKRAPKITLRNSDVPAEQKEKNKFGKIQADTILSDQTVSVDAEEEVSRHIMTIQEQRKEQQILDWIARRCGENAGAGTKLKSKSIHERIHELKVYQDLHGKLPSGVEHQHLSTFCCDLRQSRVNPKNAKLKLSEDHIADLDSIGFDWNPTEQKSDELRKDGSRKSWTVKSFTTRIDELTRYYQQHGHCRVKRKEDQSLHDFCGNVRFGRSHPGKGMRLTEERIAALDAIGFQWNAPPETQPGAKSFDERVEELKRYHEQNGHFRVKREENQSLSDFCTNVRYGRNHPNKGMNMTEERINALDAIGFNWSAPRKGFITSISKLSDGHIPDFEQKSTKQKGKKPVVKSFYERIEDLKKFHQQNGRLRVKREENQSLSHFCDNVRYGRNHPGKGMIMTEERIAALDAIGFEWNPNKGRLKLSDDHASEKPTRSVIMKRVGCGECEGCMRKSCKECDACTGSPKKRCLHRVCSTKLWIEKDVYDASKASGVAIPKSLLKTSCDANNSKSKASTQACNSNAKSPVERDEALENPSQGFDAGDDSTQAADAHQIPWVGGNDERQRRQHILDKIAYRSQLLACVKGVGFAAERRMTEISSMAIENNFLAGTEEHVTARDAIAKRNASSQAWNSNGKSSMEIDEAVKNLNQSSAPIYFV